MHFIRAWILVACLAVWAGAQQIAPDDVKRDVDRGDFRAALEEANRALAGVPTPNDRYELLMLRGECFLQLRNGAMASSTFKAAAKAATSASKLAAARANSLIIDSSPTGRYVPSTGSGAEPLDILPVEYRKQAMQQLLADMSSRHMTTIIAATHADTLPPIEQAFEELTGMWALERTATGEATETEPLMKELADHAYTLLSREITRISQRVQQLENLANSYESWGRRGDWNGGRRGLTPPERDELRQLVAHLAQVRDRAGQYRELAKRLSGIPARWDSLVADATGAIADTEGVSSAP